MSTIQEGKLVLGPELAGTLMTPEEFDAVDEHDEGYVYELIHGVLVVSPPPLESERGPNDELGFLLRLYWQQQPQTSTFSDTLPEQHLGTGDSCRRVDRVIWVGLDHPPDPGRDVPSIAVEFVSAGKRSRQRDYEDKREEYEAVGVVEYWVVDRFRRILTVFRKGAPAIVVKEHDVYTTPLLPGFELRLAQLLAVADRWKRSP